MGSYSVTATLKLMIFLRPETDDSYLCSAFDVEALSGTKEAVHITGSINSFFRKLF